MHHRLGSVRRLQRSKIWSEQVKEGWDQEHVKVIVGSQFHDFVNTEAHVLTFLHTRG